MALFSKGYRAWLLVAILLTNALNLADRQTMAAVAQAIKLDLRLTDSELGILQGIGFAIFYTLLGLPLARMAERMNRIKIIAYSTALFGAMVALCATAQGFWRLLLLRVGVGVGDAGNGPPVVSLLGDHYPVEKRASALAIVWLGAPIGVVAGANMAGWMAQHVSWRGAFLVVGIPSVLVALLVLLTLREPPRGMSDTTAAPAGPIPSTWETFRFLFSKPSVRHALIGCGIAAMSMNAIGQFIGTFLVRHYQMGFAQAGRLIGLIAGVAMAAGLLLGGFGVDWAGRFDKRWYTWGPAVGLFLAMPLFALGFYQTAVPAAVVLLMAAHIVLFVYYTPTFALAQNMVGANMRASAGFVVYFVLGMLGIGLGPTLVGFLSDFYATRAFSIGAYATMCPDGLPPPSAASDLAEACRAASANGLQSALVTMSVFFIWAAVHYVLAARTLRRDLAIVHEPGRIPAPAT